jgi:hypothetical protein
MSAKILKLTLDPGTDPEYFEQDLRQTILPNVQIRHRTVAATQHQVFRESETPASYIWLLFTRLVGPTPDTAGQGPVVLCEFPLPIDEITSRLSGSAKVTLLDSIE